MILYLGQGQILYVDLGEGHHRLAGTALSTVYNQAGLPDHQFAAQHDVAGYESAPSLRKYML